MQQLKLSVLSVLVVALAPLVAVPFARAQAPEPADQPVGPQVYQVDPNQPAPPPYQAPTADQAAPAPEENPIPPNVEAAAVPSQNGGYCYGGPHPAPGGGWEASTSPHMHDYAPFDLRLFSVHDGCYYFIGDPKDFGYTGESYSYYGAHPILDNYGGGWCFMIGAHTHWWRPWSPYFTVVGPWYYWNGPYDPFFWSYWPYYSFFYRSYYPSYYAGGRFFRTWRAAPPITHVPATGWRGNAQGGWRGSPPAAARGGVAHPGTLGGAWRGAPGGSAPYRAAPPASGGWHGAPAGGGVYRSTPAPYGASPLRSVPYGGAGGGWHAPSGGWHAPTPSSGGWHGSPGGSFHAPSGGGFHAPSGGWHGGGGGFRGRH